MKPEKKTHRPPASRPIRQRTSQWLRRPGRFLSESPVFAAIVAKIAVWYLKLVYRTNKWTVEPLDVMDVVKPNLPVIAAVWHGQHVLLPAIPIGLTGSVMISRSLDGEITARVAEAFGAKTIRASGGRNAKHTIRKGALKGFLDMKAALERGENVMQTADIPKGLAREPGLGIVALAQKTGRPIVPLAVASSKRWVLPKSWDRTTINLPFGRSALVVGELIWVDRALDEEGLEEKRVALKSEMDRITERAYELTGVPETRDEMLKAGGAPPPA